MSVPVCVTLMLLLQFEFFLSSKSFVWNNGGKNNKDCNHCAARTMKIESNNGEKPKQTAIETQRKLNSAQQRNAM